tara:strand:- start:125 stop:934 length:810 start_codon:yes stop_codon:yes gene_type:complete
MELKKVIKEKKLKIFIICRINSKRFKNKIKKKILNQSLLEILVLRLLQKFNPEDIIICTAGKKNIFFSNIKKNYNINIFYGPENNLFKRLIDCSKKFRTKHFVRITGDNPLTDINTLEKMIKIYLKKKLDFIYTNGLFPGLRTEVISISSLKKIFKLAQDVNSSEYLTYFYLRNNFNKIYCLKIKRSDKEKKLSITIDYKKDFLKLKKLIDEKNDIYLDKEYIVKKLQVENRTINQRFIPMITKKYNVKLRDDPIDLKYIDLKKFDLCT